MKPERSARIARRWGQVAGWLATILIPFVLLFLGVRILLSEFFLDVEYRLPGFPPDSYGFSLEDRLRYANQALDYLNSDADIAVLAELTFPDGAPLFNARELGHMQDVKNVLAPLMRIGFGLTLAVFGLLFLAQRRSWRSALLAGIRRGGWVTVGLVGILGLLAVLSFWQFFTVFHSLFFEGDSWLFLYSDSLIRLFPMRFWQDAFLFAGILALLGGLALGLGLRPRAG
jgi:integral membrane protein (TIGR01906 family)